MCGLALLWLTGVFKRNEPHRKACKGSEAEREEFGTCGQCVPCLQAKSAISVVWTDKERDVLMQVAQDFDDLYIEPDHTVGPPEFCDLDDDYRTKSEKPVLRPSQVIDDLVANVYPAIAYRPPRNVTSTDNTESVRSQLDVKFTELFEKAYSYLPSITPRRGAETDIDTLNTLELDLKAINEEMLNYAQRVYALHLADNLLRKLHAHMKYHNTAQVADHVDDFYCDYYGARKAYEEAFGRKFVLSAPAQ